MILLNILPHIKLKTIYQCTQIHIECIAVSSFIYLVSKKAKLIALKSYDALAKQLAKLANADRKSNFVENVAAKSLEPLTNDNLRQS